MHLFLQILLWSAVYLVAGTIFMMIAMRVAIAIDPTLRDEVDYDEPGVIGAFAASVIFWPVVIVGGIVALIVYGFYHLFRQCIRKALPSG